MKQRSVTKTFITIICVILAIAMLATAGFLIYQHRSSSIEDTAASSELDQPFDYSWAEQHPYIAHAFGGILGNTYTNSYEAFLLNYQLGHRVFEVDFFLTDDGKTVAAHDDASWRTNARVPFEPGDKPFTYDNFMSSLWNDKYHPVDLALLFRLLQQYPDIYIVTDTKFYDEANVRQQFNAFVETASTIDSSLLNRFIIQIYKPEMLEWIMEIYPWKSVIYTLYANEGAWTPENVLAFSKESGVKFITMWDNWLTPEIANSWKSAGIKIATHTINNLSQAQQSRARGADVIYTDFLLP